MSPHKRNQKSFETDSQFVYKLLFTEVSDRGSALLNRRFRAFVQTEKFFFNWIWLTGKGTECPFTLGSFHALWSLGIQCFHHFGSVKRGQEDVAMDLRREHSITDIAIVWGR
jgi:hypothetical protein